MKKRNIAISALLLVTLIGAGVFTFGKSSGLIGADDQPQGMKIVADVDGYKITEAELAPMVQQGVDRATALDRRITQSVIAKAAEGDYKKEAEVLLAANRNDILYQLFLSKKSEAIKKIVTDTEISNFYKKNVRDEDFRKAGLKIFLTSDAREAQGFYESLLKSLEEKNADSALSKMTYLQKDGDHLQTLQSIPYNLGQVVKKMKPGQVLQPIVIREGILVVYVESLKDSPKPTIEATKEEIRALIVNERLSEEIQSLRKKAAISLKG